MTHDVIIIGAGPAGLSAALVLGRCRRQVFVCDSGKPRNARSRGLHCYLTRDGVDPLELRRLARMEIARYPTVEIRDVEATQVERRPGGFKAHLADGSAVASRILLLATGRTDSLPDKEGFAEHYGSGVHHCPYCDGWEHRDQPLAVLGRGRDAVDLALDLRTWSGEITLCPGGPLDCVVPPEAGTIRVREEVVTRFVRDPVTGAGRLYFAQGEPLACGAVFFSSDCAQKSVLPENLGCEFDDRGSVCCDGHAATNVPGLYVAGNVRGGHHFAITAAAEGVEAAVAINNALLNAGGPP